MPSLSFDELDELASNVPGNSKNGENLAAHPNSPISDLEYRDFASLKLKCDKVEAWFWRQDDFGRDEAEKKADQKVREFSPPAPEAWEPVLEKSRELLKRSKDTKLTLIFCISLAYRYGFEGLRDSLLFLKLLFANHGLDLQPQAKPLSTLSGADKKRQAISSLAPIFRLPRLLADSVSMAYWPMPAEGKKTNMHAFKVASWVSSTTTPLSPELQSHFSVVLGIGESNLLPNSQKLMEDQLLAVPPETSKKTLELLDQCKALAKEVGDLIFSELSKLIAETSGDKSPEDLKKERERVQKELSGFSEIVSSLNLIAATISPFLAPKSTAEANQASETAAAASTNPHSPPNQNSSPPTSQAKSSQFMASGNQNNRAEALRTLASVKAFFEQTEPHSVIPFLLDRALRWGNMSMDKVMMELLGDNKAAMHALWERANVRLKEGESESVAPPPPAPENYNPSPQTSPTTSPPTPQASSAQPPSDEVNQADLFG
jgi:predicted component of type VI protein secretion system